MKALSRRGVLGSIAALAPAAALAAPANPERPATYADYAALDFEPIPGLMEALGTRQQWMKRAEGRYHTMIFAAASMAKTPDELAAIAIAEPNASYELTECVGDLVDWVRAEVDMLEAAQVRLLAGAARAGLA